MTQWSAIVAVAAAIVLVLLIAHTWWTTRTIRKDASALSKARRDLDKVKAALGSSQAHRMLDAENYKIRIRRMENTIRAQRRAIDELDALVMEAGGDELHLARLRRELSQALASGGGQDN